MVIILQQKYKELQSMRHAHILRASERLMGQETDIFSKERHINSSLI